MAEPKVAAPKAGERVGCKQHSGLFEIVSVNSLMQTAHLRAVHAGGTVIPNVPWIEILRNAIKK